MQLLPISGNSFDNAKQMYKAFLLRGCSDFVPVGVVKIAGKDAIVKSLRIMEDGLGILALINKNNGDKRNQSVDLCHKINCELARALCAR